MKIQEFRELIKAADRELLEKAFAESYKKFTKGQKEEVDLIIQGVLAGEDARSVAKKDTISFEKLEQEIPVFLENAYAQNYFAPNRVIPKNQRPKCSHNELGILRKHSTDTYNIYAEDLV